MRIDKTKLRLTGCLALATSLFALCALALASTTPRTAEKNFVTHEWGTFTSVQGGDGVLLEWRPLESSQLPGFVYNWQKPGLGRVSTRGGGFTKVGLTTLQRMETPVIYFYSGSARTVDVSVKFPQGLITEWFPQASQIGPSMPSAPVQRRSMDGAVQTQAASSNPNLTNYPDDAALAASEARWTHLEILSSKETQERASSLARDVSGSHYFSARETDANLLRIHSLAPLNSISELEKFIFYRGAGSFATPLKVTAQGADKISLENTDAAALRHLFVLKVQDHQGSFTEVSRLEGKHTRAVVLPSNNQDLPLDKLSKNLGEQMQKSLVGQGLYPGEAAAMVKTWQDSWFEEEGVRVLFILPRAWTDRTLPMTIAPAPQELVRVMVGRAEVLTPARQQKLQDAITKANSGDAEAQRAAEAELKKLGRFAEPALGLLQKNTTPSHTQKAWALLQNTRTTPGSQVWE